MNEQNEYEFPDDVIPDDFDQYLKNIEKMKRLARITQAKNAFLKTDYFYWYNEPGSTLPAEQRPVVDELLRIASGIKFVNMNETLKQILWKGVRFYYGLSANDFPYPNSLAVQSNETPEIQSVPPSASQKSESTQYRTPAIIAWVAIVGAFALGALVGSAFTSPGTNPPASMSLAVPQNITLNHHPTAEKQEMPYSETTKAIPADKQQ